MRNNHKAVHLRAMWLTVVEANEILEALRSAKVLSRISGRQRQILENAVGDLEKALVTATDEKVCLPESGLRSVLKCIAQTQEWFVEMLDSFVEADVH